MVRCASQRAVTSRTSRRSAATVPSAASTGPQVTPPRSVPSPWRTKVVSKEPTAGTTGLSLRGRRERKAARSVSATKLARARCSRCSGSRPAAGPRRGRPQDDAAGAGDEVGVRREVEQVAVAPLLQLQALLGGQQLLVLLAQLLLGDLDLLHGDAQLLDGVHRLVALGVVGRCPCGQGVHPAAQRLDVVDQVQMLMPRPPPVNSPPA